MTRGYAAGKTTYYRETFFIRDDVIMDRGGRFCPEIIAFFVYSTTCQWSLDMARRIKDRYKLPVLFGGIHFPLVPDEVLNHLCVDFLIRGEGEAAVVESPRLSRRGNRLMILTTCGSANMIPFNTSAQE